MMEKQAAVISHWHQLIETFHASSVNLYSDIEAALTSRQVPALNSSRIEYKESGVGSANRQYLHITRGAYTFDICAAPFGTGFFFS